MTNIETLLEKATGSKEEIIGQLNGLASQCEEKLGISAEVVLGKYESEYNTLTKTMATNNPDIIAGRAWARVRGFYKQELRSPALIFNGFVLGVSEPFDMVRRIRQEALEAWNADQGQAIANGICNAAGEPLDVKENFANGNANPKFGQPLPDHSYIRNLIGICEHEGQMTMFSMSLGDRLTDLEVNTMTPVTFRANVARTQNDQNVLSLNPYSRIDFVPTGAPAEDFLREQAPQYDQYRMVLGDIQTYHNSNSGPRRFCIVEADVMYIDNNPNPTTGSKMMVLEDESLDLGSSGITCFVPGHVDIDFGSGSRVVVCGQTSETNYQAEEGQTNYIMNVIGIFAIPELRVPADEVPQAAVSKVS